MNKRNKSVSLVELLISVAIVAFMMISFYSINTFSQNQVLVSAKRSKVQNELSYALEHMSKYVQQGIGDNTSAANRAIQSAGGGFRVRVDLNNIKTPSNLNDNAWIRYRLIGGNTLNVSCSGTCGSFAGETFSSRVTVFNTSVDPNNGSFVDIDLIGRYNPNPNPGNPNETNVQKNPLVEIRTKLFCNSCSVN